MLKKYGIIGLIIIVLVEINFFLKIEPLASLYFPLIWFSYILVIDALVYKIRKNSLINNHFFSFIGLFVLSIFFWYTFEFLNIFVKHWEYIGTEGLGSFQELFKVISFSTVLPAFFETSSLIKSIHLFDKIKLKRKYNFSKSLLYIMIILGIFCFFLPIFFPRFTFPLIWLSFFLLLDPINYMNKQPSVIGHLKDKNISTPLSLLLAGIILGFLWEFWNYWAVIKWKYDIPFVGFFKIFEMPVLGYLGYFPFALELYAMYWFFRSLFTYRNEALI